MEYDYRSTTLQDIILYRITNLLHCSGDNCVNFLRPSELHERCLNHQPERVCRGSQGRCIDGYLASLGQGRVRAVAVKLLRQQLWIISMHFHNWNTEDKSSGWSPNLPYGLVCTDYSAANFLSRRSVLALLADVITLEVNSSLLLPHSAILDVGFSQRIQKIAPRTSTAHASTEALPNVNKPLG
jgi:hypothetical protein